jgi:hypothetical protein
MTSRDGMRNKETIPVGNKQLLNFDLRQRRVCKKHIHPFSGETNALRAWKKGNQMFQVRVREDRIHFWSQLTTRATDF